MNTVSESERKEIEELLPWYAAGTLNRRDAQRVEATLGSDPELARRYELVREELGQTIQLNETLGAPSAHVLDKLFAKIDAEPARRTAASPRLGTRISEFFGGLTPRALVWSAAVATIAILLEASYIADLVLIEHKDASAYQTASTPSDVQREGSFALIRFQPQTTAADITKFLETNKLSLAGGPSAGELYRVRVAPVALPKDELAGVIKKLQSDKVVDFIATTE